MKYTLIAFEDKQLKLYTTPSVTDLKDTEEIIEDCRAQIIRSDKRAIFKRKNLVKVGIWDSKTGTIKACDPEFLLNCDEVISAAEDYERNQKEQN